MRFRSTVMIGCALLMLSACWEPPYRYDIRGNGQGGIDIQKVPKEPPPPAPALPPPAPPPRPTVTAAPPPPPPAPVAPPPPVVDPQQQRINELESRVRELSAENQKLKMQSTTAPATGP